VANGPRFRYSAWFLRNPLVSRVWRDGGRVSSEVLFPSTGGGPIAVTDRNSRDRSPSWSSDGRRLFFVSNRGGSMGSLATAPRGGRAGGCSGALDRWCRNAKGAFSPDGTKLAYSKGRLVGNVWRVPILRERPASWADAEQITIGQAYTWVSDISPDGRRLLVSSDRSGNRDIWVLPAEGGAMTQLTTNPTGDGRARWSPDGREIAFRSRRSGNLDLWVMPAEGGPARQLTSDPEPNYHVWWSPDGRRSPSPRTEAVTRRFGWSRRMGVNRAR